MCRFVQFTFPSIGIRMWPDFLPPVETPAIALPAVVIAYVVFGVAGFGAAMISTPALAHALPVVTIVPLLALLDRVASTINGVRQSDRLAKDEIICLVPLMVGGSVAGIYLLLGTWLGHHITLRLRRDVFFRMLYLLLVGTGLSLVVRALSGW